MSKQKPKALPGVPAAMPPADEDAGALYQHVREILVTARRRSYSAANAAMVEAYWRIGQRIVEHEQQGAQRAAYGERLLAGLAARLNREFGKGYNLASLRNFRQFFRTFGADEIRSAPRSELTWTHYRAAMRV
jgi:DUF1016 N-terminal domain